MMGMDRHPHGAGPDYLDGEMPSAAHDREAEGRRIRASKDLLSEPQVEAREFTAREMISVLGRSVTDRIANLSDDSEIAFADTVEIEAGISYRAREATGEMELTDVQEMIEANKESK